MTDRTVSDVASENIREIRKRRGLKPADLAARCAQAGAGFVTDNVIENIESGRRKDGVRRRFITIDELLAIARALEVTPVVLCPDLGVPDDLAMDVGSAGISETIRFLEGVRDMVKLTEEGHDGAR